MRRISSPAEIRDALLRYRGRVVTIEGTSTITPFPVAPVETTLTEVTLGPPPKVVATQQQKQVHDEREEKLEALRGRPRATADVIRVKGTAAPPAVIGVDDI